MVASVSSSASFIPTTASVGRPADTRVDAENISSTLRRNVALTAKFGPDPATGSPFQLISGEDVEKLSQSPHLEGFKAKGIEVLFMTDPVDEFWLPSVGKYSEKDFQSVTKGGADLDKIKTGQF